MFDNLRTQTHPEGGIMATRITPNTNVTAGRRGVAFIVQTDTPYTGALTVTSADGNVTVQDPHPKLTGGGKRFEFFVDIHPDTTGAVEFEVIDDSVGVPEPLLITIAPPPTPSAPVVPLLHALIGQITVMQGDQHRFTIRGDNLSSKPTATCNHGLLSVEVVSNTTKTVVIQVAAGRNAKTGPSGITVTCKGESTFYPIKVIKRTRPEVSDIVVHPNGVIEITGRNFSDGDNLSVTCGTPGVAISDVEWVSPALIQATLASAHELTGEFTFTVTDGSGDTATIEDVEVDIPKVRDRQIAGQPLPEILGVVVHPNGAVEIIGRNFSDGDNLSVTCGTPGVAISDVEWVSPALIQATLASAHELTGEFTFTVTDGSGDTATIEDVEVDIPKVRDTQATIQPLPEIDAVYIAANGAITIVGKHFAEGDVSVNIPGLTVRFPMWVSASEITGHVVNAKQKTLTGVDVTVTDGVGDTTIATIAEIVVPATPASSGFWRQTRGHAPNRSTQ